MFRNEYRVSLLFLLCAVLLLNFKVTPEKSYEVVSRGRFTMDQFIGVNAFVDDPIDKLKVANFVREYHNWEWDDDGENYVGYPNNQLHFAPGIWNFDQFYQNLRDSGISVSPCIQGGVKWLHQGIRHQDKPTDHKNSDPALPSSYHKKAHHMFQFAARYGSNKVAHSLLTLAPGQPRNTGMGMVKYVEDWNEQNKSWEGEKARFKPEEYAAMASANYDGHENTLKGGKGTFGVKNADPNIKMVMGGLAGVELDYIERMKIWFEQHRKDKQFAADVLNFHIYGWKSEEGGTGGGPAKSPEESHFKERLEKISRYRDEFLPKLEIWVSEFGWDTNPKSPLCAPSIGRFDSEDVQGQWLVRSFLAFAAAGVDRAQMYMLRDVDPASEMWYASCGLVGPKGNWKPKKSWYYVSTLKSTLKDMVFEKEIPSANPKILVYRFKQPRGNKQVYAIWAKTSIDYRVENYTLSVPENVKSAIQTILIPGNVLGASTNLRIENGNVQLAINEKPTFLTISQ